MCVYTEFSPTEPPDHHQDQSQLCPLSPPVLVPPSSRPSATTTTEEHHHPSSASHTPKPSCTDMSATRYGGQNKRSPQPKAEVSSSSSKGRGSDTGSAPIDKNRNDHVRGNQGAGLEGSGSSSTERRKGSKQVSSRKGGIGSKEGNSNQWNNQKNRSSREVGGVWAKTPSPTTTSAPVVATRGVSSNSSAPSLHKTETTMSSEGKLIQSQSTRSKSSTKQSSTTSKGHRSNHTSELVHQPTRDSSPSSSSVSSSNETSYQSAWGKNIYSSIPPASSDKHQSGHTPAPPTTSSSSSSLSGSLPSNQKPPCYEERGGWSTSQDSDLGEWGNEVDLEDHVVWPSTCSTDDDKISKCILLW